MYISQIGKTKIKRKRGREWLIENMETYQRKITHQGEKNFNIDQLSKMYIPWYRKCINFPVLQHRAL